MNESTTDTTAWMRGLLGALLIVLLVGLGFVAYAIVRSAGGGGSPPEVQAALETTLATATVVVPTATVTAPPTSPPVFPTPEPTRAPDLRLGVTERTRAGTVSCTFFTEVVQLALADELGLTVSVLTYDSADSLFTALAADDIDVTLCFLDPADRRQIAGDNQDRLGYIRHVGTDYWRSDGAALQVWSNGRARAAMVADGACALNLLENMVIAEAPTTTSAAEWLDTHRIDLINWLACQPAR
jgi:hypothetical protein